MKMIKTFVTAAGMAVSLAAGATPAHAMDGPARVAGENFYLSVDLSERRLYVMRNGEQAGSYAVAIGQPRYPTPTGRYRIRHIVWNPRWVPPDSKWAKNKVPRGPGDPKNPMGKVKIFFKEPDYYVHGTREVDSLGQAESHGCLRMRNADVIALAKQVMEHGGAPREEGWFSRIIHLRWKEHHVSLKSPVAMTVSD